MTIGPRIPFNVAQDALAPMGDKHAGSPGSPSASSSPGRPGVSSSARSGGYRDSRWKFLDGLDRSVHGAASEELAAASSDMGTTITEVTSLADDSSPAQLDTSSPYFPWCHVAGVLDHQPT